MKFSIGPTGKIVQGHVLDVSKSALERKLHDYDRHLYVKWNPKKRSGLGCWEIRRRPEKKSAVLAAHWNGMSFLEIKPVEIDIVHHVLDVPFLNYDVLTKLQKMDTWTSKDWVSDLERKEAEYDASIKSKATSEMNYMIKQHKREVREFRELLLSGFNPGRIAQYWGRSK